MPDKQSVAIQVPIGPLMDRVRELFRARVAELEDAHAMQVATADLAIQRLTAERDGAVTRALELESMLTQTQARLTKVEAELREAIGLETDPLPPEAPTPNLQHD